MHAVDIYGLSEVIGRASPTNAWRTKDGPARLGGSFYPEIITPVTGRRVPKPARRAGVHLAHQGAMPVVRYRTRDLTR